MAESRKKPGAIPARGPEAAPELQDGPALSGLLPREELDNLSTLQLIDLIAHGLPTRHPALLDLAYLRERVVELEETGDQATRQTDVGETQ
jgi:hypothetical protein